MTVMALGMSRALEFRVMTANFWCSVTKLHEAETDTCSISYTCPSNRKPSILNFSGSVPLCHRATGYRRCYKPWYLHLQRPRRQLTSATLPANRVWRHTTLDPQQHGSDNPKSSSAQPDLQLKTLDCRIVTRISLLVAGVLARGQCPEGPNK
jgi:hypothetical protein